MKLIVVTFFITFSIFHYSSDDEKIGVWNIKNGKFIRNHSKNDDLAELHWKTFYDIFPKTITKKYIKKIVLISDGLDEKTGALAALSTRNDQWQLVIDTLDVNFRSKDRRRLKESVYTLVHEFGHLLTLNNTQIRPTNKISQEEGEPYLTLEGEAYKNSYLNKFVSLFWKGKLLEKWDVIKERHCFTEESCVEKLFGLYKENFADFVTDYAAESPEEDIVESWTYFVLKKKIKNPKTIAQKKINFFYEFPELVEYRKLIRYNTRYYLH
ncbi:hypothetical protein ACQY1Q_00280 [Tenacibaculum sp. TC6]|uniref:hypothetical protein n=1 Tax=Tenacibaculum sp. TC6 TaxID=3423223 RepID=UPI003D36C2DD